MGFKVLDCTNSVLMYFLLHLVGCELLEEAYCVSAIFLTLLLLQLAQCLAESRPSGICAA